MILQFAKCHGRRLCHQRHQFLQVIMLHRAKISEHFLCTILFVSLHVLLSSSSSAPKWMVTGLQGGGILRSQFHRMLAGPTLTQVTQSRARFFAFICETGCFSSLQICVNLSVLHASFASFLCSLHLCGVIQVCKRDGASTGVVQNVPARRGGVSAIARRRHLPVPVQRRSHHQCAVLALPPQPVPVIRH